MRNLHQDAGAVAGQRVGADGAAMGRGSPGSGGLARRSCGSAAPSGRRRSRRRRHRARASDRRVLAPAAAKATPGIGTRERPTRCHRHMKPRPRLTPRARGGQKSLGQRPDLHQLRASERLKAKTQLPVAASLSLPADAPDKGQQACPIRPINDRFPGRAQAGFKSAAPFTGRHCDLTGSRRPWGLLYSQPNQGLRQEFRGWMYLALKGT